MISSYQNLNEDQWLLRHSRNATSQEGEDGIIEKIFEIIASSNRWCVEFGAADGTQTSNTYSLMTQQGWEGVFIEPSREPYHKLVTTYRDNPRAHTFNSMVEFEGRNSLDSILGQTQVPRDFDLLSIDIDGNDYHIWESLRNYEPRVVLVEFNLTIPPHVEFVQPRDMRVHQGSSPLSLAKLGKRKGYELISLTGSNAIFVRSALFPAFHIANNTVARLRPTVGWDYHIFQLFDGTFVVGGPELMHWQALPLRQEKFQIIPRVLREFDIRSMSFIKRATRRFWAFLYRRGLA